MRELILDFAKRYDFEEGHSLQDEHLALRLFDETGRLCLHTLSGAGNVLGLLPRGELTPRQILSFAALLHDIGYVAGYEEHHKTAFKLIDAADIPGLRGSDRTLVALVARFHRGSLPDPERHKAFAKLEPSERTLVNQLGAILRFADGLDRSHTTAVRDLRCRIELDRLAVSLLPGVRDEEERVFGKKKARWFESVFGVQVMLS